MMLRAKNTCVLANVLQRDVTIWDATTPAGHQVNLYVRRCYGPKDVSMQDALAVLARVSAGEVVELYPTAHIVNIENANCRVWLGQLKDKAAVLVLVMAAHGPQAALREFDDAIKRGEVRAVDGTWIPAGTAPPLKSLFQGGN